MKLFLPLSMAWLACACTYAQTADSSPAKAVEKKAPHSLRLLCVEASPAASQLVVAEKTDKGWVARWRLSVSSSFMTDPLGLSSRQLALALDPSPPPPNGGFNGPAVLIKDELIVKPIAEFELPATDIATAVLVPRTGDQASPYRVIVLDANQQRFGAGKILVQNFTTHVVGGKFGGKSAKLASGQSAIVEPGVDQEADMAQITLAKQVGEEWEPFCDTRWPGKVDYRRYLLLIPRGDGSIHPFVMPEYPPFR